MEEPSEAAGPVGTSAGLDMEPADRLREQARSRGLELSGENGPLQQLTKCSRRGRLRG
ncbi:hypothetical protein GCM10010421_12590 [Streptomyces glaucus]|uniref:Uncharacterized protein n=1 Tax=Streptomyces glaucus TaxID=284029 RepID=A0ABN3JEZ1_9ACTN